MTPLAYLAVSIAALAVIVPTPEEAPKEDENTMKVTSEQLELVYQAGRDSVLERLGATGCIQGRAL